MSEPPSPRALSDVLAQSNGGDTAANLANNIHALRQEVREGERENAETLFRLFNMIQDKILKITYLI